jgi:anti-sigma factor RsiW
MTTNAMTCVDFSERLMAYLEHETDDPTRATLERHALTCAECGALLADLRSLRVEATKLPELAPSRDLWSGIAARIEAPVVPIGTVRQVGQQRSRGVRRWASAALIAASLLGAAGIGYFTAARRTASNDIPQIAQQPETIIQVATMPPDTVVVRSVPRGVVSPPTVTGTTPAATEIRPAAYVTLVADYDREIAKLHTLIDQRRSQLDPVTVAIIEKNLQVIDGAITECKKAIARDPSSRFLIESLNQSLQSKVELMRTAALLPTRT